jgi:hypothetical protein
MKGNTMPSTTTILTVSALAATAIGVAYVTNPVWFGHASAPKPTAAVNVPAAQPKPDSTASKSETQKAKETAPLATAQAAAAAGPTASSSPAQPPATPAGLPSPPDALKSPAEAALPAAWIGLPVIAVDGATVGQVTETRPHADGKSVVLVVKGSDGKTYDVSSSLAKMQGRAVQVAATATEIGKMVC